MLKCEWCGTYNEFDSYYRDKRRYTCERCGAPLSIPEWAKYHGPQFSAYYETTGTPSIEYARAHNLTTSYERIDGKVVSS